MNDYVYQLTDMGRERARRLERTLHLLRRRPGFAGRLYQLGDRAIVDQAAPDGRRPEAGLRRSADQPKNAVDGSARRSTRAAACSCSARPGNGKTSIAERVTKAFGTHDLDSPGDRHRRRNHPPLRPRLPRAECRSRPAAACSIRRQIDKRWVRIRRPTIVVGGELTMANLEVTLNTSTGISEAPLQLKSNCGTLVIDDFGRQRMQHRRAAESLDRAAGKAVSTYLNLPNGKKIQVPFDQLVIFSTNLEPQGPGRRGLPAAHSLQDRGHRSDGRGISQPVQDDGPQARLRVRRRGGDLPARHALPPQGPVDALLPAARSADADPQHVPVRDAAASR